MAFSKIIKITTSDANINKLQDNIISAVNPMLAKAQLDNQQLLGISLTSGITNQVPHKLNRKAVSFSYAPYANATVWQVQKADSSFFYLACSANVTIDCLVW